MRRQLLENVQVLTVPWLYTLLCLLAVLITSLPRPRLAPRLPSQHSPVFDAYREELTPLLSFVPSDLLYLSVIACSLFLRPFSAAHTDEDRSSSDSTTHRPRDA